MNKKEFIKLICSSVEDRDKQIRLSIRPTRGDRIKILCGITLVTPADKLETIFISNMFSRKKLVLNVQQFIDQFPIEGIYDSFNITANISHFNGESNVSLILVKLNEINTSIVENDKVVDIAVYIDNI